MNKVSYTEEGYEGDDGYNQSPNPNSNDLTTNQDFNGMVNSRAVRSDCEASDLENPGGKRQVQAPGETRSDRDGPETATNGLTARSIHRGQPSSGDLQTPANAQFPPAPAGAKPDRDTAIQRLKKKVITFASFIGPGFMISVAYSMLLSSPISHSSVLTKCNSRSWQLLHRHCCRSLLSLPPLVYCPALQPVCHLSAKSRH
jgi:metal iron transporter